MKHTIIIIGLLILQTAYSQVDSGVVTYQFKFNGEPFTEKTENSGAQNIINNIYKNLLSASGRINYSLIFDKNLAKYAIKKSLDNEYDKTLQSAKKLTGANEVIYINRRENFRLRQLDFFGDDVLIKENLQTNWNFTQDKRKIGNYTCYRAWIRTKKGILIEAWYTPEIPLNLGPKGYGNLPGLVIELRQAKLKFIATEIVLNPKEKPMIKFPKNKKFMEQEEFEQMLIAFDKKHSGNKR